MPQVGDTLQRGSTVGRYLVLDKLGEGGMGLVYAAYDPELNRKVALKLLRPSVRAPSSPAQARLLREAQAMARVSHANVISVFDVGTHGDQQVFVAMEFVDGGTLNDWLLKQKRTVRDVVKPFIEAGRGLAAAHAAGLVHRDFKPENVLLGSDGRVRVTDFGLARLTTDEQEAAAGEAAPAPAALGARLTQVGAIVGTPLFMSPEQHRRQTPDARSDQFNFCASLYWAIYGSSPLLGLERIYLRRHQPSNDDHTSTVDTMGGAGHDDGPTLVKEFPKEPRLPASVRRALVRGLSLDPDKRYPSMEELLKHLSYDPQVAQRRWAIGIGAVAALGVVGVAYQKAISRHSQLCQGADRQLETVWNDDIRGQVKKAFAASGSPYAERLLPQAQGALDAYGQGWVSMRIDACEATRLRGEQTEEVLSLRMSCLDRRLVSLGALIKIFTAPDAKAVDKSLDAALQLPGLPACADVAALKSPIPLPEDQATRKRVDELERKLAESKALSDSGNLAKARQVAEGAMKDLAGVNYAPIRAEMLGQLGWIKLKSGDITAAEAALAEAVSAGEEGRKDDEKALALGRLVYVKGYSQGKVDEAAQWFRLVEAAVKRAGSPFVEQDAFNCWGNVLLKQGRSAEAAKWLERGATVAEQAFGELDPRTNVVLANWASALQRNHKPREALKLITRSIAAYEKTRGPNHPTVGGQRRVLAQTYLSLKDNQHAYEELQKAVAIHSAAFGMDSVEVASDLDWLAVTLQSDGLYAEALQEALRSMTIREKVALPKDSIDFAYSLENIGQAYLELRRPQDAVVALERAIAIHDKNSHEPAETAEARFALARALWDVGRDKKRAVLLAEQARQGYGKDDEHVLAVAQWQLTHQVAGANKGGGRR
jgi:tetratricopeptide (TPR) repeat protein/predicted Ser/Thr protein kinase